jgi:GNAT superfamily N-acetyltransferase
VPSPSGPDDTTTTRLKEILRLLGMTLADHIILGKSGDTFSYAMSARLNPRRSNPRRRNPETGAYAHDEGDHGTGEQVVGLLDDEPVGSINVYSTGAELNRTLKAEEYARFRGLPRGKVGWLGGIELPESSRNKGHGAAIVAAMLEEAKRLGVKAVVLHADSAASQRFWSRMGFEEQEIQPDDYRKGLWMTPMLRKI